MTTNSLKKLHSQYDRNHTTTFKVICFVALVISLCYIFSSIQPPSDILNHLISIDHCNISSKSNGNASLTDLSHLVFGVAGSVKSWKYRRPYIDLWWRPNQTRGILWLDRAPPNEPWPVTSPPFQISGDISKFKAYDHHGMPFAIRMTRVISETFNMNFTNVRWFVMADDDTVLFIENLVEVLQRYDHRKYYYIGSLSECVNQNAGNSFEMAFGGAGYAMSYPLVRDLSRILDGCIKRYPYLFGSDHILQYCIVELGVSLTQFPGFHQFDIRGDLSGYLSAHPLAPLLSFHHIDAFDPIFPNMTKDAALGHLMEATMADHSRILQQTVCYDHNHNLSFSISWGYSVHIYEKLHAPAYLHIPIQTFSPWNKSPFMFNVRSVSEDPCLAPHVFFFKNIDQTISSDHITTTYDRKTERRLPACANYSADSISQIVVLSPIQPFNWGDGKRECCKVTQKNSNVTEIKIRSCSKGGLSDWTSIS